MTSLTAGRNVPSPCPCLYSRGVRFLCSAKLSESESAKKFEDFNHRLALFHKHFLKHGRFVGGDHPSIADYLVQSLLLVRCRVWCYSEL